MINREVKGNLARLLATENLTVEHRQVTTAYFEVDKRVLVLPIWKNASSTVYDLLVGHEVGHALYTPNKDAKAPKAFVNILEDVRIERMMKVTYPGLRKSFFEGYKELWDQDFFGVKYTDNLDTIPFIDRINLYFKGNNTINFTPEEQVYVDAAERTKSFDDVEKLAIELYQYAQDKEDAKEESNDVDVQSPKFDQSQSGDSEEEVQFEPTSSDDYEDQDQEEGDGDGQPEMTDEELLDELQNAGGDVGAQEFKETESVTDEAFAQALESLVDTKDHREWKYLTLPEVDVDKAIVPAEKIQEDLHFHFEGLPVSINREDDWARSFNNIDPIKEDYRSFKKDARKSVDYLVKQFEMKKAAEQYTRAATAKTGVIDTNSLYKYKIVDDIFKKVTVTPDGKNHGLVMFLDWSGSMQYQLLDTLKQTYNLVWFCKKAGIPFRVYAFSNGWEHDTPNIHPAIKNQEQGILSLERDFKLFEFFSSKQNAKSLEKSLMYVYLQAASMERYNVTYNKEYTLGGTPLGSAILCSRYLVDRLKRVENVSKVNVVCLTDGESNPLTYLEETDREYYYKDGLRNANMCHSNKNFVLRDPKTGYTRRISSHQYETTKEIISFFKEITNYNWIGIRLCDRSSLNRLVRNFAYDQAENVDQKWRKEKYASIKDSFGFTEAFFMPQKDMGGGTLELEVKQKGEVATRAELGRAFKKHMGSKMTNKKILNAFIEQIA